MNNVFPGILEQEWSKIEEKIKLAKTFTNTLHIDIIDGKFANNTTFLNPAPFKQYSNELFLELHMMVENPIEYLKPWADAGFKRFLGHIEKMPNQEEFIREAKKHGEAGLALDGGSNIHEIKVGLNDLDCVLIMTINAGLSGQKFDPTKLDKVKNLRHNYDTLVIEVDGGTTDETIVLAKNAGANRFITTSFLFGSENPASTFQTLQNL